MDVRQLRYFVAVIDTGSITRAGRKLFVAQPSISQAVVALEAELGLRLFDRGPRGVDLTEAGRALEGPVRQLLSGHDRTLQVVGDAHRLRAGSVRFVVVEGLPRGDALRRTAEMRRRYPGVRVDIGTATAEVALRQVGRAEADIALVLLPVEAPDLAVHPLHPRPLRLVLPPGSPGLPTGAVSLVRLGEIDLVTGLPGDALRAQVEAALAAERLTAHVVVETGAVSGLGELVLAGVGAALLPEDEARRLAGLGAEVRVTEPTLDYQAALVTLAAAGRSPAAQAILDATPCG